MTDAVIRHGATIYIGDGEESESFSELGEVTNFGFPTLDSTIHDVTNQESSNDTHEKIRGMKDIGPISYGVNWIPDDTTHARVLSDWNLGTLRNFRITGPSGASFQWDFAAYVKTFQIDDGEDDAPLTATITLDGISSITFTS